MLCLSTISRDARSRDGAESRLFIVYPLKSSPQRNPQLSHAADLS
jgi:hypothetical protein